MLYLASVAAALDVTGGVARVIVYVLCITNVSAICNVTGGVASVIKLVIGHSCITALIALGVAIAGEYVNALPNGNKINRFGNRSLEIPIASIGKSPTNELVSALCGSFGLRYGISYIHLDVLNVVTVCRIKGNGCEFRSFIKTRNKITSCSCQTDNGNQTK